MDPMMIVAATDFSDMARAAVERAALIARKHEARLTLIYAFDEFLWENLRSLAKPKKNLFADQPVEHAWTKIRAAADRLSRKHGIIAAGVVAMGHASEAIASTAAAVFAAPGRIVLDDKPVPIAGPGEAVIRITTTTICGTDVHVLKGEYPVAPGRIVEHEPVGVIDALGPGVAGYSIGQRVIVGAITPCGQCYPCLDGHHSQCGGQAMGGWRFGNTIDGSGAYELFANQRGGVLKVAITP